MFFAGILKVNDENRRIRIQDPDPDPNPNPLVGGMDPRIRIRIHTKMSWIRNTGNKPKKLRKKIFFFVAILKVTDLKSRIRIRQSEVRIRIRTSMSRIRNIGEKDS